MIKHLKLSNVGPAPEMELDLADRLNLFTGDNGLGKSFLLDIAWWAMTRSWPNDVNPKLTAGRVGLPTDKKKPAEIAFSYQGASTLKVETSTFEARTQRWSVSRGRPANPGLVLYAMADGSFALWDPARNYWKSRTEEVAERPAAYVLSPKEVWDGLQREDGTWLCNGLIRDWAGWQKEKGEAFRRLEAVLAVLSPSGEEPLRSGGLTRIRLDDARDMPTLRMPYGQEVAVVHASAGMRRMISLAYVLVWGWEEHLKAKDLLGEEPEQKVTFLVDEVESHLHPKWQRSVIPALLKVMETLSGAIDVQLVLATHSPLIMASVEPLFDAAKDAWFDLDIEDNVVQVRQREFEKRGDVRSWLTSEAFDLKSGYALETEHVLEEAAVALSDDNFNRERAHDLDQRLRQVLSEVDPFWMRWRYMADKKGWLS